MRQNNILLNRPPRATPTQAEREAARRRTELKGVYSQLKARESDLDALLASVSLKSDVQQVVRAEAELSAIRRMLATAPEDVAQGYRLPESAGERERRNTRERLGSRIRTLEAEIKVIVESDLPGLEIKLKAMPTARDVGQWRTAPDPRARHYEFLEEQKAAKLARAEECRAEIARLEAQI